MWEYRFAWIGLRKIKIAKEIDTTVRLNGVNVSAPQAIRTNEIGTGCD